MKRVAFVLRVLIRIASVFSIVYFFLYIYRHPQERIGVYLRLPILYLGIRALPLPSLGSKKKREVFQDNVDIFAAFGKYLQTNDVDEAAEQQFTSDLLKYIKAKGIGDGSSHIKIKRKKNKKRYSVQLWCTSYNSTYYWVPKEEEFAFENYRLNNVGKLDYGWYYLM